LQRVDRVFTPAALVPFDTLRRSCDWTRWHELAADAPPYLGPEFFALIRPLSRGGTPLVAEAWSSARMLGALPLVLDGDTLRAMRSDHSPGYDFCGDDAAIVAIWSCLRDDDRWTELVLDKVPVESPLAMRLPELARVDGYPTAIRTDTRHLFFDLPGFEDRLAPRFRTSLAHCARRAGDIRLERIAVPTRADLDDATAIDPRVDHVYRALGRVLGRRGRSALCFLRADGHRIATLFTVEDRRTLFVLTLGSDSRHARFSPGHLLVWQAAVDAERRGLRELDFAGGDTEWKRRWTDRTHAQVAISIYKRSPRGLFRYAMREMLRPRPEPEA
jgi:Acetyltransferase (GNAT) domain